MLNKLAELKKDRNNKKKRHFLYEFFNPKGSGKGLSKEEARQPRNFVNFFKFYSRNFNTMFALNVFAFLGNFPILFGLYALTQNLNVNTTAPASSMFGPLYGAMTAGGANPISAALFGVHGAQARISLPTTATYVFFGLTALVFLTFGIVNLATAYVMRNIVKGDPSMLFSDIKYSIKRNWKQGMLLGIIDLLFILVIAYDLFFFYAGSVSAVMGFMLGVMVIVAMIYTMMRYYMYIMLVTFDLSIYKSEKFLHFRNTRIQTEHCCLSRRGSRCAFRLLAAYHRLPGRNNPADAYPRLSRRLHGHLRRIPEGKGGHDRPLLRQRQRRRKEARRRRGRRAGGRADLPRQRLISRIREIHTAALPENGTAAVLQKDVL